MTALYFLSVIAFGLAWLCGYWAIEVGTKPEAQENHEWLSRQLTAGAWTFAVIVVAALVAAAYHPIF